ncbi:MAG: hypothetical protein U9Q69_04160 [Nanoarchaeota archaeon]|nr:hypothetical protein [Nanoarchaeota archaeon]
MFKIDLSSYSQKFLKKADKKLVQRIIKKIRELSIEPFPQDSKRVVGRKEKVFRIRIGDTEYFTLFSTIKRKS